MSTTEDGWITGCRGAWNVHTKFFGLFALDVEPAQAPRDMRAKILAALAEITEGS